MSRIIVPMPLTYVSDHCSDEALLYVTYPVDDRIVVFESEDNEAVTKMYLKTVIRKEDVALFRGWKDTFQTVLRMAEGSLRGTYVCELVYVNLRQALKTFNPINFSRVIGAVAQSLNVGQASFMFYASLGFIIAKRQEGDWGKCALITQVETYNKKPESLHLEFNALFARDDHQCDAYFALHDLSSDCLFREQNTQQLLRLRTVTKKRQAGSPFRVCASIVDHRGLHRFAEDRG